MKKLALALVCLASVAFFASCQQNGVPSIQVLNEEGYVKDGDVIDLGDEVNFGFVMSSAIESNSPLTSLIIKIDDNAPDTVALTGTSYTYRGTLVYGLEKDEIVGNSTITATVYDATGQFATASITISLNQAAQSLVGRTFEWYRLGNTITGLEEYGLWWDRNLKATHAQIKPLDGVKLFKFEATKWTETTTDVEKAALFSAALEAGEAISLYDGINTDIAGDQDYDEVIGTITADGEYHLMHITHYNRGTFQNAGYPYTITGEAK